MRRTLLSIAALATLFVLAGGVVRLTRVDDHGAVRFAPEIDRIALAWYVDRASELLERARVSEPNDAAPVAAPLLEPLMPRPNGAIRESRDPAGALPG